jgi:hypothetical protein
MKSTCRQKQTPTGQNFSTKKPPKIFPLKNQCMKINMILIWTLRLVAAIILLQTLFFKFSAAPESVALFTKDRDGTLGAHRHRRAGIDSVPAYPVSPNYRLGLGFGHGSDGRGALLPPDCPGPEMVRRLQPVHLCADRIYLLRHPGLPVSIPGVIGIRAKTHAG